MGRGVDLGFLASLKSVTNLRLYQTGNNTVTILAFLSTNAAFATNLESLTLDGYICSSPLLLVWDVMLISTVCPALSHLAVNDEAHLAFTGITDLTDYLYSLHSMHWEKVAYNDRRCFCVNAQVSDAYTRNVIRSLNRMQIVWPSVIGSFTRLKSLALNCFLSFDCSGANVPVGRFPAMLADMVSMHIPHLAASVGARTPFPNVGDCQQCIERYAPGMLAAQLRFVDAIGHSVPGLQSFTLLSVFNSDAASNRLEYQKVDNVWTPMYG